ncbi:MAG: M56 family metallopeptidase [Planctomycetota bacterium]
MSIEIVDAQALTFLLRLAIGSFLLLAITALSLPAVRNRARLLLVTSGLCLLLIPAHWLLAEWRFSLPEAARLAAESASIPGGADHVSDPAIDGRSERAPTELSSGSSSSEAPARSRPFPLALTILVTLASGALVRLAFHTRTQLRTRDIVRGAVTIDETGHPNRSRARVAIRMTPAVDHPLAVGWLRPVILVPPTWPDWSGTRRRAVLRHELSHIASLDWLARQLASVALAVYWWQPLMHWLVRRLRLEQEVRCDRGCVGEDLSAASYASLLVQAAREATGLSAEAPAFLSLSRHELEIRVRRLLDGTSPVRKNRLMLAALPLAAILTFGFEPWPSKTPSFISSRPSDVRVFAPDHPVQARWTDGESTGALLIEGRLEYSEEDPSWLRCVRGYLLLFHIDRAGQARLLYLRPGELAAEGRFTEDGAPTRLESGWLSEAWPVALDRLSHIQDLSPDNDTAPSSPPRAPAAGAQVGSGLTGSTLIGADARSVDPSSGVRLQRSSAPYPVTLFERGAQLTGDGIDVPEGGWLIARLLDPSTGAELVLQVAHPPGALAPVRQIWLDGHSHDLETTQERLLLEALLTD